MYDHVIDMEQSTPKARLCAYKGPVAAYYVDTSPLP